MEQIHDSQELDDYFDEQDEAEFEAWAATQEAGELGMNDEEEAAFDAFLYLTSLAWQVNVRTPAGRIFSIKLKQATFVGTTVAELKVLAGSNL